MANCIVLKVAKVDFVIAIHCIGSITSAVRERSPRSSNGAHFKSGYVVIMRKDTSEFEDLQRRGPELGQVHGVIYRKAFGESCKHKNVLGEGFGIINRESKIISGAFNLSCNLTKGNNMYHDDSVYMNSESARYVFLVVLLWKLHSFPERQTHHADSVEELSKCKCIIL